MSTAPKPRGKPTRTLTLRREEDISLDFVEKFVKDALSSVSDNIWGVIERFLHWLRVHVTHFLKTTLSTLPIVGRWASRIGSTVADLCFAVAITTINFLRVIFKDPALWKHAHGVSMVAWNENEDNGLLAQSYSYAKKMAGYCMEVIKQCFERAIKAQGLEISDEEKNEIDLLLDWLLKELDVNKSGHVAKEHNN